MNQNYIAIPTDDCVKLNELPPCSLIISDVPGRNDTLIKWLSDYEDIYHVKSTYNSLYSVTQYVENGAGVAICPASIRALLYPPNLIFKPMILPAIESRLDLVWLKIVICLPLPRHFSLLSADGFARKYPETTAVK